MQIWAFLAIFWYLSSPEAAFFYIFFFWKKIFIPKQKKGFFNKAKKMIHVNFWIYIIAGLVTAVDRPQQQQQPARSENKSTPILFMGSLRSP